MMRKFLSAFIVGLAALIAMSVSASAVKCTKYTQVKGVWTACCFWDDPAPGTNHIGIKSGSCCIGAVPGKIVRTQR